jgi:hypothetical protein
MRALVRTGLQQLGIINVREFPTAAEALSALEVQPPHTL